MVLLACQSNRKPQPIVSVQILDTKARNWTRRTIHLHPQAARANILDMRDLTAAQSRRLAQTPASRQQPFRRAYAGTASPRTAIKAQCLDCVGCDTEAITTCTATACPLWLYRPYQTKSKVPKTTEAISLSGQNAPEA